MPNSRAFQNFICSCSVVALCVLLFASTSTAAIPQGGEGRQKDKQQEKDDDKKDDDEKDKDKKAGDEEPVVNTDSLKVEAPEVDPQFLRFEMWDGTVVSGVVSISAIDVETEFGNLEIPIERLVDFHPGLVSLPELRAKVDGLVEDLGSREFKTREDAHREIVKMGPLLTNMLPTLEDGGNAERKKHLVKIRQEIAALLEEEEDEDDFVPATGIHNGDQIQTPDFSIAGKILQEEFRVKSKIGDLKIMLSDVKRADRGVVAQSPVIRKTVYVSGQTFFQKKAISTKIRVNKGDRIDISASGVVQWTNWSQSSTPDGLSNQGQWNGLSNGSLAARIGSDGDVIGIGSDHEFKAKKSGILYLAVAMADNYANNTSYRFTGKFKAKVKVEPAP